MIDSENPYQTPDGQVSAGVALPTPPLQRRWLDTRCAFAAMLSVLLGASMWKVQAFLSGNTTFQPDFFAMLFWFTASSLAVALIDPRSPWLMWPAMYFGAYILALPFFPRDPLIGLGLIAGLILTGFCACVGTFIPTLFAYSLAGRSPALRGWAGYVDKDAKQVDPYESFKEGA